MIYWDSNFFSYKKDYFICACPPYYTGVTCQTYINPCTGNQCHSGSTCQVIPNTPNYQCICSYGYRGVYCDQIIPACESNPCVNGIKLNFMIDIDK